MTEVGWWLTRLPTEVCRNAYHTSNGRHPLKDLHALTCTGFQAGFDTS
jgi:hypothetical protein